MTRGMGYRYDTVRMKRKARMKEKVLVAYASVYGSTREVAEAVAMTLSETRLTVDLQPVQKVKSLGEYGAVVLGAPIYLGVMHKDMQEFLSQHQEELTERPPVIFALGPLSLDEKEWQDARATLDKELAKLVWLTPLTVEMFGGKYNPAKLRFAHRLITSLPASPLHGVPAKDIRDWVAISAWANSLAMKFLVASPQ